jgi:hypothetical protein
MAINYKDSNRTESKRAVSGPIFAVIVAIGGLLWLGPETTAMFKNAVVNMIRLPIF